MQIFTRAVLAMWCISASIVSFSQSPLSFASFKSQGANQEVVLSSQAQVDAFKKSEVSGNLIIHGNNIRNLRALVRLTRVGGSLTIHNNPNLTSLEGLTNLTSVGGKRAGGQVVIKENPLLENFAALNKLTQVPGVIHIEGNKLLKSIDGFTALTKAGGVNIVDNDALADVNGFSNLTSILSDHRSGMASSGVLLISGNKSLTNIKGLLKLSSVVGVLSSSIVIKNNKSLQDLDGLTGLTRLKGMITTLEISNNASLLHVGGLQNLKSTGRNTRVVVRNNPLLGLCCGLTSLLEQPSANVHISGNGKACSAEAIRVAGACKQPCEQVITLRSQAEVDAFGNNTCAKVFSLSISGADITNLDALAGITVIESSLVIRGVPQLTTLQGLSGLTSVGGAPSANSALVIENNEGLLDAQLAALTTLNGSLHVRNNATLNTVWMEKLQTLNGGTGVGEIVVSGNPFLWGINFPMLNTLKGSSANLTVEDNTLLSFLDFPALRKLQGTADVAITISQNASLTSLRNLALVYGLEAPARKVVITDNALLSDCCGLYNLITRANPNQVVLTGNAAECSFDAIIASGGCYLCQNPFIALRSQEEVDMYPTLYGCKQLTELSISGADITNLDSLAILTQLTGGLHLKDNPNLTSTSGLRNLETIGDPGFPLPFVEIENNASLKEVKGFDAMVYAPGLTIQNNPKLTTISAFSQSTSIRGTLVLRNNPALTNIDGFSAVNTLVATRFFDEGFVVQQNNALQNLDGLSSLQTITSGLGVLTFNISDNASLTNVDGLQSLTMVEAIGGAQFTIDRNAVLASIDGLNSIVPSWGNSAYAVEIVGNPLLSVCCAALKITCSDFPSTYTMSGNAPSCTFQEITRAGGPCAAPSARMAFDVNIYPNPNNGRFSVNFADDETGEYKLVIRDFVGGISSESTLAKGDAPAAMDVNMSNLPSGLYTAQFYKGQTLVATKRVVVKN